MKEILKAALTEIKTQLIHSEETVEYTSWLTASIFSVLGVFTIFLSHQYQNHTSEMMKLIYNMKKNVEKENEAEFEQNVIDFEYLSKTPKVLLKAVRVSIIVLWFLTPVWLIAGASKFMVILESKGETHYLSLILTFVVTGLFIFFSISLAHILSKLSSPEDNGVKILTPTDLFNAINLSDKNFDITKLMKLNNINWNFLITGTEPYTQIKLINKYGIFNCSSLIYMEATGYDIYLSSPLVLGNDLQLPKENNFELSEQERVDLQRFFLNVPTNQIRVSHIILVNNRYYYFTCIIERQGELYKINIQDIRSPVSLPTEIKAEFENNKKIIYVDKQY
ncbi:hypothetical protein ACEWK1_14045 [Metabacillus sp. YM-086]|uniref:hypothetical protein n=1 Tax=Metabacillus sp. YM-086 TaxID=3341729 RepID=UPI003A8B85DA